MFRRSNLSRPEHDAAVQWRTKPTRRKMNARMTISPMSGSALIILRKSARLTRTTRLLMPVGGHQNLLIVEQVELAGELPLAVHSKDPRLTLLILIEDFDFAVEDQEEVDTALARSNNSVLARPLLYAVVRNAVRCINAQPRKCLRLARVRIGRIDLALRARRSMNLN